MKNTVMVFNHGSGSTIGTRSTPAPRTTLTQQVEAELKKHPGVVAFVDEASGKVATFMKPVSPWAVTNEQLGELRTKVQEAETALRHAESRGAGWSERTRLEQNLKAAQRELEAAEFEKQLERNRQGN